MAWQGCFSQHGPEGPGLQSERRLDKAEKIAAVLLEGISGTPHQIVGKYENEIGLCFKDKG